ncbi:hypothetical protein OZX73_01800 [Bifidobacterium sp. ESL0775]|uniref:hypothetical protein n=1 Tax=Bifidobacterium sp. ESL0775 TaxID=2983230 RepID=UPI0023F7DD35|nr:hypothetical protein [Bifidobacterium sp. ESL0775]WEV69646.1 hypothetical protein OZX73_01800 [Bifidobacterium sp. ESL0775]
MLEGEENLVNPDFIGLDSLDEDEDEYWNSKLHRFFQQHLPAVEFLWKLETGMGKYGDSSSQPTWLCQKHRTIDLSQPDKQLETWTFEIDWDCLSKLAIASGINFQPGQYLPLPILKIRRFVPTEYKCTSHPEVYLSHRHTNDRFATMITIRAICGDNYNDRTLQDCYLTARNTYNYGCSRSQPLFSRFQKLTLTKSMQQQASDTGKFWAAYKDYLSIKDLTDDEISTIAPNILELHSIVQDFVEDYPVLAYIKAKQSGHESYTFTVNRYAPRWSLRRNVILSFKDWWRNDAKNIRLNEHHLTWLPLQLLYFCKCLVRVLLTLCRFKEFTLNRQWLRQSSFLELDFASDCRPAAISDWHLNGQRSLLSGDVLFSPMSSRNEGEEDKGQNRHTTYDDARLLGFVIPKLRVVVPIVFFIVFEALLMTSFLHILSHPVDASGIHLFQTALIAQFALAFIVPNLKESPMVTNLLMLPRFGVPILAIATNAGMMFASFRRQNIQATTVDIKNIVWNIQVPQASMTIINHPIISPKISFNITMNQLWVIGFVTMLLIIVWLALYTWLRIMTYAWFPKIREALRRFSGIEPIWDPLREILDLLGASSHIDKLLLEANTLQDT